MVMQVLEPVSRKALAMEPSWHDFGNIPAQTTSAAQVFTVTNWLDLPITFPLPPATSRTEQPRFVSDQRQQLHRPDLATWGSMGSGDQWGQTRMALI
jgi:hypothetical protein